MLSTELLRTALEERIRMGPDSRRSVAERLAERSRNATDPDRAAALAEADRAVAAAEALARDYQAGVRTQRASIAELLRLFPWLSDGDAKGELAAQLGQFGFYLVIM